jgi:hypothetical protein
MMPSLRTADFESKASATSILSASSLTSSTLQDRVPSRGVTPQPGRAEMHAVLIAAQQAGERGQYR